MATGVNGADAGAKSSAHVIVIGSEKGGSGKSTLAIHVAVALMQAQYRVATIDLDGRQSSFTHYIERRTIGRSMRGFILNCPPITG